MENYEVSANASMSLAESIAAATKSAHARLNRRILQRLPLALPPRTSDPTLYLTGLLHVAPIYITFEALWRDILNSGSLTADGDAPQTTNGASRDVLAMLQRVHMPDLLRSEPLRADIAAMTGWLGHVVEQHLATIGRRPCQLADFLEHIRSSVGIKPHVLLSYSYIFFMALFAGGRIIRARLDSAGHGFWDQTITPITSTTRGEREVREPCAYDLQEQESCQEIPVRFLRFRTPSDGEDLKRDFKSRLSESEAMLTAQERQDIVQEAVRIFENMTLLMDQLDEVCGEATGLEDIVDEGKASAATMHSGGHPSTAARTPPQRFGLCPAMSVKSRDSDRISPLPERSLPPEKPGGGLRLASMSMQVVSLVNKLLLAAALTAIILWALVAGRRCLVEW